MTFSRNQIAATADAQASSDFFDKLPLEIRQKVYRELWAMHDIRQHVDFHHDQPVLAFPCIRSLDDEDGIRYQSLNGEALSKVISPWNTHWLCAEKVAAAASSQVTGRKISISDLSKSRPDFDAPLLVCKRMYLESVQSLEDLLTFCFNDIFVAKEFLANNRSRVIRNLDISIRLKPLITELYMPGPDGEPQPHIGGIKVTADNNPWEELCCQIVELPYLKELHFWLDSMDLRRWHKRVNERRFFARLFDARARAKFILYLPEIPEEQESLGLPGCYLEGRLLDNAPFVVKRGPRPDNWQSHLARVGQFPPPQRQQHDMADSG